MKRSILVVWMALLVGLVGTAALKAATFEGLGDLAGGGIESKAWGVSADGSVVVGVSWSDLGMEAFRWTPGQGMVGLGSLPGSTATGSRAYGVSDDGSVVVGVGALNWEMSEAFRWTADGGMVGLGDLPGGLMNDSQANDVSADGSVVVGTSAASGGERAFMWTADGGMVNLGTPSDLHDSYGRAVSADGSVVVGRSYASSENREAFRWTADGGMVGLGDLLGGESAVSSAHDVSADGSIVVGFSVSENGGEAFLWTAEEGMIGLGDLPDDPLETEAHGVTDDGSVVVGRAVYLGLSKAFIWDATYGMRNLQEVLWVDYGLDLAGWELSQATDVSDDGRVIVGFAVNPDGNKEGWRVVIPEPSSVVLAIGALLVLLTCGLRKRGRFGPRV